MDHRFTCSRAPHGIIPKWQTLNNLFSYAAPVVFLVRNHNMEKRLPAPAVNVMYPFLQTGSLPYHTRHCYFCRWSQTPCPVGKCASVNGEAACSFLRRIDGTYSRFLAHSDNAGNSATVIAQESCKVDATPPTVNPVVSFPPDGLVCHRARECLGERFRMLGRPAKRNARCSSMVACMAI